MTRIASPSSIRSVRSLDLPAVIAARTASKQPLDTFETASVLSAATGTVRELNRGTSGADVKAWQDQLVKLGYLTKAQAASGPGTFGPATEAATRLFQKDHGLVVSGRVGVATRKLMGVAITSWRQFKDVTLERGMKNEAVRVLKQLMVKRGLISQATYDAHPSTFGSGTQEAVRKFQREHGLNVSGRVGEATWGKLQQVLANGGDKKTPNVPYISQFITRIPGSFCGPTSVGMIARAFGKLSGFSDAAACNWLADQANVGFEGTGWPGVQTMARAAGLQVSDPMFGSDLGWVDRQLAAGKLVAANGDRSVTLANSSSRDGIGGGHWIVVTGKDASGNYLVQDPSTDCKRLSPAELARYFYTREGDGVAVAISP